MSSQKKGLQRSPKTTIARLNAMSKEELIEAFVEKNTIYAPVIDVKINPSVINIIYEFDIKYNSKIGKGLKVEGVDVHEVDFSYFQDEGLFDDFFSFEANLRKDRDNLSSSREREVTNSMRVFFRFVKDHASVDGTLDIRHVLNQKCLEGFERWCNYLKKKPSTIINHFKYFSQFWKWFSGQDCAKEWVPRLQFLDNAFKDRRQKLSESKSTSEGKISSDLLLVMGKWLTEDQHKELCKVIGESFATLVDADQDFVEGRKDRSKYGIKQKLIIMDHVYLLGNIYCGGQRRQFVQMMDSKNLNFTDEEDQYYIPEEKTRRQNTNFFVLPKEFSIPLRLWLEVYAASFRKSDDVVTPWLTMKGTPQNDSKMSHRMGKLIFSYFPGHWITPLYFRRNSVTLVTKTNLTEREKDPVHPETHAMLINTSPAVMRQHYDRFNRSKVNKETLDRVNAILGASPGARLNDFLARHRARLAKSDVVSTSEVLEIVDHEFATPDQLFYTVRRADGSEGRVPAIQTLGYIHHVELYLAKIGGLFDNPRLSYEKVSAKGFSIKKLLDKFDKKAAKKNENKKATKKNENKKKIVQKAEEKVKQEDFSDDDFESAPQNSFEDCSESDFSEEELRVNRKRTRTRTRSQTSRTTVSVVTSALPPTECQVVLESFEETMVQTVVHREDEDGYDSDWMFTCEFDEHWDYSKPPPKKKQKIN